MSYSLLIKIYLEETYYQMTQIFLIVLHNLFSLIVIEDRVQVGRGYQFVLNFSQKVDRLLFLGGFHGDELLVEVGLDTLIELEVNELCLPWQLETHDDFSTLMDAQLSNLGRSRTLLHARRAIHRLVIVVLLLLLLTVSKALDHFFKSSCRVRLDLCEGQRAGQL